MHCHSPKIAPEMPRLPSLAAGRSLFFDNCSNMPPSGLQREGESETRNRTHFCTIFANCQRDDSVRDRVIRASRPPAKSDRSLLNWSHRFRSVIANQRSAKKRTVSKLKSGPKKVRFCKCLLTLPRACLSVHSGLCILHFAFSSRTHFCTIFAHCDANPKPGTPDSRRGI
jgi:hypothetical protein